MPEPSDAEVIDLTNSQRTPLRFESCPVCNLPVPVNDLDDHCDAHFSAEGFRSSSPDAAATAECSECRQLVPVAELESHELAHAIDTDAADIAADFQLRELQERFGFMRPTRMGSCYLCGETGHWVADCSKNRLNIEAQARILQNPTHGSLVSAQRPDPQWGENGGDRNLMCLLQTGIKEQRCTKCITRIIALLSAATIHFGGGPWDAGWGCGYRNIQMLSAHLLASRNTHLAEVLFGGSKYVPDVQSLQAWIEVAWAAGFDVQGAEQLGGRLQGSSRWIGSTEAAALFRYFGVPAKIVDFGVDSQKRGGLINGCSPAGRSLLEWTFRYFSEGRERDGQKSHQDEHNVGNSVDVIVTGRPPLYLQHEGHSRTIIGVERRVYAEGRESDTCLLLLDPGVPPPALQEALENRNIPVWQRLVKRGAHTLRQSQFQVLYCPTNEGPYAPGTPQYDDLKVITAVERY